MQFFSSPGPGFHCLCLHWWLFLALLSNSNAWLIIFSPHKLPLSLRRFVSAVWLLYFHFYDNKDFSILGNFPLSINTPPYHFTPCISFTACSFSSKKNFFFWSSLSPIVKLYCIVMADNTTGDLWNYLYQGKRESLNSCKTKIKPKLYECY